MCQVILTEMLASAAKLIERIRDSMEKFTLQAASSSTAVPPKDDMNQHWLDEVKKGFKNLNDLISPHVDQEEDLRKLADSLRRINA